jgi:transposase-like protein
MRQCPKCKSEDFHRSRVKSKWEYCRNEVTGRRPYRCHACGWRRWSVALGAKFGEVEMEIAMRAMVPEAPNLRGFALAREDRSHEVNLDQLDNVDSVGEKRE